jgi:hypothetical protein
MRDDSEAIYGWCGLCHSFSQFPHDCPGQDLLAEGKEVDAVGSSPGAGLTPPNGPGAATSK